MKADDFKSIPPYDQLADEQRAYLASQMDILYLAEGQQYPVQASIPAQANLIIPFKGRGKWESEDSPDSIIHPFETAGALTLISQSNGVFTALEEVLAYVLPNSAFQQLCQDNPTFKAHWTANLQEKRQALQQQNQANSLSDFMMAQAQDAWLCPITRLSGDLNIKEAAAQLRQVGCSAALVELGNQQHGIITHNDLLGAFIDHDLNQLPKLATIASPNPISIDQHDYLFNALLLMTEHNISHLLVKQQQQPIGILQQKTLLSVFANQSVLIAQQLERAQAIDDLVKHNDTLNLLIRSLHTKGMKPRLISELVSALNRHLFKKVAQITCPLTQLPNFALLTLGSEGRQEQILRTDQDNALIWDDAQVSEQQMQQWATAIHDALQQLGFPDCPGNIMVTNPLWRQSLSHLQATAKKWILQPSAEGMMHLAILLDADTAAGNNQLTSQLLSTLHQQLARNTQFLAQFAKAALQFETPLGMFSHFITDKVGNQRLLDLKKGGIFAIVHGTRVLACEQQIYEQTTHRRLQALADAKRLDKGFASELAEALDFMQQLRLTSQLDAMATESTISNAIDTEQLNHLQRDMLKDAFKLVDKYKDILSHHYKLHLLG